MKAVVPYSIFIQQQERYVKKTPYSSSFTTTIREFESGIRRKPTRH